MRHGLRAGLLGLLMVASWPVRGQTGTARVTERTFVQIMNQARAQALHRLPLGEILIETGLHFRGSPYAVGLLDASPEERLVVDLTQFDCVLYVEVVLAMALGIAVQDYAYDSFKQRLQSLRYRDGSIDGYCSRLHYFSEWIADNHARGHVQDVTRTAGGVRLAKTLDFMSSHRGSYPRLVASDSLYAGIVAMERRLAGAALYHIPQGSIDDAYSMLQDGDVLAMTTDIRGLDVTHTGLAFSQPDGTFGLLHASTEGGVKVSPDLAAYVRGNRIQIGIVVARPVDPRLDR